MSHLVPLQDTPNVYRIYCEDRANYRSLIIDILTGDKDVDGYTLIEGTGYYKGVKEKSLIIEIFGIDEFIATRLAEKIRRATNQESVAIAELAATVVLVERDGAPEDQADGSIG
jgi:hypothetical protein